MKKYIKRRSFEKTKEYYQNSEAAFLDENQELDDFK